MPSVSVTSALWDRLWVLTRESDQSVEELVDELLSEAVVEREWSNDRPV